MSKSISKKPSQSLEAREARLRKRLEQIELDKQIKVLRDKRKALRK